MKKSGLDELLCNKITGISPCPLLQFVVIIVSGFVLILFWILSVLVPGADE